MQEAQPQKPRRKKRPPRVLPIKLGETLKGYKLEKVIGHGGMGTVYLGTHNLLGREAAIKVLKTELAREETFVSRFFHEAKVVNDIKHPNIVDILDFVNEGTPPKVAYIMEYVDGPTLKVILKKRRLTLQQGINVGLQLASTLMAVHASGVIHRDLKPDNVLVTESLDSDLSVMPSAKILDFGIAKITGEVVGHQTMAGEVLGTPKYMAPEQITADAISPATDVYALAEIFYEIITGTKVFNGPNAAVMTRKLSTDRPELKLPEDMPCQDLIRELVYGCIRVMPKHRMTLEVFNQGLLRLRQEALGIAVDVPIARRLSTGGRAGSGATSGPDLVVPALAPLTNPSLRAMKPGASGSGRPFLIAGATALIAASTIGGAIWWASQPSEIPTLAAKPIPEKVAKAEVPPEPTPPPAKPASVMVKIETTPAGAQIVDVRNGSTIATTPASVEIMGERKVAVMLDGYKPVPMSLTSAQLLETLILQPKLTKQKTAATKTEARAQPKSTAPAKSQTRAKNKNKNNALKKKDLPSW